MPIQANRHVGPAVQPARCRPLTTPDVPGLALGQKPGWWCDGRGMLWENDKGEGETAVERGQYDKAENFFHAAIEQAEQVGSLNPCLAGCLNEPAILYAKQHKYAQAELLFQRALGVSVAALGSDLSLTNRLGARASTRGGYDENDRRDSGHPGPLWGGRAVHSSFA